MKPDSGWLKLNTDGCRKGNSGSAGVGGVIRDNLKCFIFAYAETYGKCSNNMAEVIALKHGTNFCTIEVFSM